MGICGGSRTTEVEPAALECHFHHMIQVGRDCCISKHFPSVCWPAGIIYWDTSSKLMSQSFVSVSVNKGKSVDIYISRDK